MARFLVSRSVVRRQISLLQSVFDRVSYSYKTNPVIGDWIIRNMDIPVSINSFGSFLKLREHADRIIYFLQGETKDEIREMVDSGVREFVTDNENDLGNLLEVTEDIHLFLRVKLREHTIYTGKYFVYGLDHKRASELVKDLRERVRSVSIHFHKKTQNISEWYLKEEFADLEEVFPHIDYINIGGGIPWVYHSSKPNLDMIMGKIREFREWLSEFSVRTMAEPGRFIAGPAVRLEAIVRNIYGRNVILDCSIFNAYMDTFLFNLRLEVEGEGEGEDYLLKGCTPDSLDIFRYSVRLPRLKVGDKIIFKNAGAYNFHTDFNDLPRIEHVWTD